MTLHLLALSKDGWVVASDTRMQRLARLDPRVWAPVLEPLEKARTVGACLALFAGEVHASQQVERALSATTARNPHAVAAAIAKAARSASARAVRNLRRAGIEPVAGPAVLFEAAVIGREEGSTAVLHVTLDHKVVDCSHSPVLAFGGGTQATHALAASLCASLGTPSMARWAAAAAVAGIAHLLVNPRPGSALNPIQVHVEHGGSFETLDPATTQRMVAAYPDAMRQAVLVEDEA